MYSVESLTACTLDLDNVYSIRCKSATRQIMLSAHYLKNYSDGFQTATKLFRSAKYWAAYMLALAIPNLNTYSSLTIFNMGPSLSKIIKEIDGSDDAEKATMDSLNALFALGQSRNEAAFAKATSDAMKVYAPIQKLLMQRQTIIAGAQTDTDSLMAGVKTAIGNLISGKILDG